jgi:hypothetical protein
MEVRNNTYKIYKKEIYNKINNMREQIYEDGVDILL